MRFLVHHDHGVAYFLRKGELASAPLDIYNMFQTQEWTIVEMDHEEFEPGELETIKSALTA